MTRNTLHHLIAALALGTLTTIAAGQAAPQPMVYPATSGMPAPTSSTTSTVPTASTVAPPQQPVPVGTPAVAPPPVVAPLPVTPTATGRPVMFGSQMFSGRFGAVTFSGFNPDYQLAIGDRVLTRLWGAIIYEATQPVDAQGNIFIPNVGPVKVVGVRNGDLNQLVDNAVKKVFRANVGVYATLEAAQPVKVYVTGFVRAPGLYGGLSSDSVLYYLDRAGGIDPERGSYLAVDIMRNGKLRASIDLYKFLLKGQIEALQLQDGDTIVIPPRRHAVIVTGEVLNPLPVRAVQAADHRSGPDGVGLAHAQRHPHQHHPIDRRRAPAASTTRSKMPPTWWCKPETKWASRPTSTRPPSWCASTVPIWASDRS
jgi:protein involved in polysaccharide export with SLBB domain